MNGGEKREIFFDNASFSTKEHGARQRSHLVDIANGLCGVEGRGKSGLAGHEPEGTE